MAEHLCACRSLQSCCMSCVHPCGMALGSELGLREPRPCWDRAVMRPWAGITAAVSWAQAQPGIAGMCSWPSQGCSSVSHSQGLWSKGCEQSSSALMVCTLKAAREVMNCGFDHLLVVPADASVCNLDTSRTLPQAETDPFVRLN